MISCHTNVTGEGEIKCTIITKSINKMDQELMFQAISASHLLLCTKKEKTKVLIYQRNQLRVKCRTEMIMLGFIKACYGLELPESFDPLTPAEMETGITHDSHFHGLTNRRKAKHELKII